MTFASYLDYMIYLGIVFAAGFVVGYFWKKVKEAKDSDISEKKSRRLRIMFKPWISIPTEDVIVAVDHDYGDVRLMFKDVKVIDNVIEQLKNLRELTEEMEAVK